MALPASLYANVVEMPKPAAAPAEAKPTGPQRLAAARTAREQETALLRAIDRADAILDRLDAQETALAAEIKRLQARKAHVIVRRARIEARILTEMSTHGLQRAAGHSAEWTARANAASLVVDDENAIPAEYMRENMTSAPNKVAIKVALAADPDLVIPGCHLEQSVSLVRK